MITLYGFGPMFGLPTQPVRPQDPDPAEDVGPAVRLRAPPGRARTKGEIPLIRDGESVLGDSVFILDHLKRAHGVDLDAHLTAGRAQRRLGAGADAGGSSLLGDRPRPLGDDANFEKGPSMFFAGAPEEVKRQGRAGMRERLVGQGSGRHADAEIADLAGRDFASASGCWATSPTCSATGRAAPTPPCSASPPARRRPSSTLQGPRGGGAPSEPDRLPVADDGPLLRAGVWRSSQGPGGRAPGSRGRSSAIGHAAFEATWEIDHGRAPRARRGPARRMTRAKATVRLKLRAARGAEDPLLAWRAFERLQAPFAGNHGSAQPGPGCWRRTPSRGAPARAVADPPRRLHPGSLNLTAPQRHAPLCHRNSLGQPRARPKNEMSRSRCSFQGAAGSGMCAWPA